MKENCIIFHTLLNTFKIYIEIEKIQFFFQIFYATDNFASVSLSIIFLCFILYKEKVKKKIYKNINI